MRVNSLKAGNTGVRNEIVSTCDELLSVGKDAARQIGKHALDVSKTAAIDAGKRLVDNAAVKMFPAESYLLFEGKLTRANGEAYANADLVALSLY